MESQCAGAGAVTGRCLGTWHKLMLAGGAGAVWELLCWGWQVRGDPLAHPSSVPSPATQKWLCSQDHSSVLGASLSLSPLVEVVGTFLGIHEGKAPFGYLREDPQCSGWSTRQVGVCCCCVMGGMSQRKARGKPRGVTKDSSQDAQSSLRSKGLLVLDLKAKNP